MKTLLAFYSFLVSTLGAPYLDITGGQPVPIQHYPYQVSLQIKILNKWYHQCGGAIISPNWILTAAHCLMITQPITRVVAGVDNLENTKTGQIRNVDLINSVIHDGYNENNINDIALIKVTVPLQIENRVRPIEISKVPCTSRSRGILTGFGVIDSGTSVALSKLLRKAELTVLDYQACSTLLEPLYGDNFNYWDEMHVCTSGTAGPCILDDGSPLIQDGRLIGVLSWLPATCSTGQIPTIYMKVGDYVDFIEAIVDDLPSN